MRNALKITSVNAQKSLANTDGILEWATTNHHPVICVQEPALPGGRIRRHPGYHTVGCDDKKTRSAIYIAKGIDFTVPVPPLTHTTSITIQKTTILNTYWHPDDRKAEEAIRYTTTALEHQPPTLLVGDFNAHHPTWDPARRTNPRSDHLDTLTAEAGLTLLNTPGIPTHRHTAGKSTIDLAFGPGQAHLRTGHWVSDHRSLHISLPNNRPPKPRTLYTLPAEDIQDLAEALGRRLTKTAPTPTTIPDLEEAAWYLLDTVEGTTREYSIRLGGKPKNLPWWNKSLAAVRDTHPEIYRKACRQTRTEFYKAKIENAHSPKDLGKILRWRKDPLDDRPLLINTGTRKLTDPEDIATYLADAAFRPANTRTLPPYTHHGPTLPQTLADKCIEAPSDEEVLDAFCRCSSNTPGPDGIPLSVLRAAWEHILPHAKAITTAALALGKFPTAFKKATVVTLSKPGRDTHTYKGWRPITLLSTIGKGLERLIARRMTSIATAANLLPTDTAGAVPTRSATDLVMALTNDAEEGNRLGWHGIVTTFDIDSAFPSVRTDKLGEILEAQRWPQQVTSLAQDFCVDRTIAFRWANTRFRSNNGLPQGSPWSPILFLLFTASLPANYYGPAFAYADDIAHLTMSGDATHAAHAASLRAADLHRRASDLGLRIDHRKTEALYLPPRGKGAKRAKRDPAKLTIRTPAGPVTPQRELKWLGVHLDATLSLHTQVRARAAKSNAIHGLSARINRVAKGLHPQTAKKLFTTCLMPSLTYGAAALFPGYTKPGKNGRPVHTRIKAALQRMETAASKTLRATMPVWRTVQKTVPFWLAGVAPAEILGREIARTAARLHTLPNNHPLTVRLNETPITGWSRLTSIAKLHPPTGPAGPWIPRHRALREWLNPGEAAPAKAPRTQALPPEADPELYWQTQRPPYLQDTPWHRNNPYLDIPRAHLARWIGEKTGHYDFHSYHDRFNHPPAAYKNCFCGAPQEKGHLALCPLVTFRNPLANKDTPRAFSASYATYLNRIHNLKADGYSGARPRADGSFYGIRTTRPETPDPDDEPLPLETPGQALENQEDVNYDGRRLGRTEDTETETGEEGDGE